MIMDLSDSAMDADDGWRSGFQLSNHQPRVEAIGAFTLVFMETYWMLEYSDGVIIGDLPDEEIEWATDVLRRFKTSWPDEADTETAIMIKERALSEGRWTC